MLTVAIMRSPEFFPQILKLQQVGSIGSGSGVDIYVRKLEDIQKDPHPLWQPKVNSPGGFGHLLLHNFAAND
jgi:hypothetical protein